MGYDSTNIYRIWIPSKKKVISTTDVMFNKSLFYDPKEAVRGCSHQEAEETIEVYKAPRLQQRDMDEKSDTDSDLDLTTTHGMRPRYSHEPADPQEEEDLQEQERRLQQHTRESYHDDDFLPGTFPDDIETITGGFDPILPTPDMTPEPSSSIPIPRPKNSTKTHKPRDSSQGMLESNIQEGKRTRKPSEKARQQSYLAALGSPENL